LARFAAELRHMVQTEAGEAEVPLAYRQP
jgi:hypothetical protein